MTIFDLLKELEKKIDIKFDILTLDGRIEVQKSVFLLKYFKIKEAMKYNFDIYLHGPYSAKLADEYLSNGKGKLRIAQSKDQISDKTIQIIRQIILKDKDKQTNILFLEGFTTLLSLRHDFIGPAEALIKAKTLKPYMKDSIWKASIDFINEKELWDYN
ncbi:hypothetical protein OXIME_001624 [Oxyplasma meridianum]|uniref:Uncharacterized protein n=1 Tax=Oxyplasma meridianum TaxID=3073602 RepID=A0AAX4NIZ5_9ARCH